MPLPSFPLPQNMLSLPGPAGQLEAIVSAPLQTVEAPPFIGIICHPHPLHGGTMQNKVVSTLARVLYDLGGWSVRFNFRGVGASAGAYDAGHGEVEDLRAVIAWVRGQFPSHAIWLAGFSFGAYIAMQGAASAGEVKQLISIAPAVDRFVFPLEAKVHCPWVLAMGEQDEVVPVDLVKAWVQARPEQIRTLYLPTAGHFFHGQLLALRDQLKAALYTTRT
jgi:alpha/beta superfamily hydrolase